MKTLLLWDIDGTLIDSGGAGERALQASLIGGFGITDTLDWLDYFGRTDAWIARKILNHHGLPETAENLSRFLEGYLTDVARGMQNPAARILPGIVAILEHVAKLSGVTQGLLTGNLERGAKAKLGHFGLWRYVPFGAFADDSETRNDLGPHAVRRAQLHHKLEKAFDRVIVIGDTPHDIECGRAIGAETVAVATGKYSSVALAAHTPTYLFESFTDPVEFYQRLKLGTPQNPVESKK